MIWHLFILNTSNFMKILDVQLLMSQWLHLVKACLKPWLYDLKDSHIAAKVSELGGKTLCVHDYLQL